MPDHQGGLDESGHSGGGVGMADVRLHRAQPAAAASGGTRRAVGTGQGGDLDGVAQRGGRAVRLDVADGVRVDGGVP